MFLPFSRPRMSLPRLPRLRRVLLPLLPLVLGAACTDLPTGTDAFQLEADGRMWVAVVPPSGLPDAATWLSFAGDEEPVYELREQVEGLQAEARRARGTGDGERADRLLADALRLAVESMAVEPDREVFRRGMAALSSWEGSVRVGVKLERSPELREGAESVARDVEAVQAALANGDFRQAAVTLTEASEQVRRWSPDGVAMQVLDRVEAHLAAEARTPNELERTAHLVDGARAELVNGNPLRAMQRALYALQLAGGSELREIPVLERARCGEFDC